MIKHKILLLAIGCFAGSLVFSQSLKFGIKAGTDIHKLNSKSFKDEFSFGYHAGFFLDIGIMPKLGIQPEVLFSQVTADTSSSFRDIYQLSNISKVKLTYLNIPLILNYKFNPFVSLQVGPQYGLLIDQGKSLFSNGKEAFKKGDFSMLGGLQIKISKIRIYGRYVVGLNNINDIDNRDKWKNQTIHLGLGLAL
jgi:hypothetical protein